VFAGKACSAVSPLPQDCYAKFSRDPLTGDAAMALRAVLCITALPKEQRV